VQVNNFLHDLLNDLLAAEGRSLLPRLVEAGVHVQAAEAAAFDTIRRLAARQAQDRRRLVDVLLALGGEPRPAAADIQSADFHFLNLSALLPRVIASQGELVRRYERSIEAVADCPPVAEVVRDLADRHRACTEVLEKLAARIAS